jgi:hypothetical protein
MANPTMTSGRSSGHVTQFASGNMFISELDANDMPVLYVRLGWTKGSKIAQAESRTAQTDDSGQEVASAVKVSSVMVDGSFISRAQAIREMYMQGGTNSLKGKKFALVIVGSQFGTTFERWMFWKGYFTQEFDYGFGTDEAVFKYTFVAEPNTTGATRAMGLPSGIAGFEPVTTAAITFGNKEFFYTDDTA